MSNEDSPRFMTQIAGRTIVVRAGSSTQTVNICTAANKIGDYEAIYRLPIEAAVSMVDLPEAVGLNDLGQWLEEHNGLLENHLPSSLLRPPLPLVEPAPGLDDPWVQRAVAAVEKTITDLIRDFTSRPFLHRVEHSIHAELFARLVKHAILAEQVLVGQTTEMTQLVHKEWPETYARRTPDAATERRGLFDLAILAPAQLQDPRTTLEHFRQGRIAASIVIEIGLDYGFEHLQQDHAKVLNSKVPAPFLIHLTRLQVRDESETEALVCDPVYPVQVAYVQRSRDGQIVRKHLSEDVVSIV